MRTFYLLLVVFFPFCISAQNKINRQAMNLYQLAERLYLFDAKQAFQLYEKATKADSTFAPPYMRMGQILLNDPTTRQQALAHFQKAITLDSTERAFLNIYEILGMEALKNGQYVIAQKYFKSYIGLTDGTRKNNLKSIQRYLAQCNYAQHTLQQKRIDFQHNILPKPFNQALSQSYPVLTPDLQTFIFTRNNGDEDLYVSYWQNNQWTEPKSLSPNINSNQNEGTCTLSADGRTLIFTACDKRENIGTCDLYITYKIGDIWQKPKNMGAQINSTAWQSQPTLSADGRTLYFSSSRVGGLGGKDIWESTLDSLGWSKPINLGTAVNTDFDEVSPFIHSNGISLFYASDNEESMGGFDIFLSKKEGLGWSKPQNIGYPLNDFSDQVGFFITPDCSQAYYAHLKYNANSYYQYGVKQSVLCQYNLPDSLLALCPPTKLLKAKIIDKQSRQPIAVSVLINNSNYDSDDSTGVVVAVIAAKSVSKISIEKEGYYPQFLTLNADTVERVKVVELMPISVSNGLIFSSLEFENNSAVIAQVAFEELDNLANYLSKYPNLKLLIEGHTDDVGSLKDNQVLSENRANTVANYLIEKGIGSNRIATKGYGKTQPLLQATTPEARQKNRRVVWKIIGK